jgi:hypothetical protein
LFYITPDGSLMAAAMSNKGGTLDVGKVSRLFGGVVTSGWVYDVSADGQRFLALVRPEGSEVDTLTVVQNWTATLKE